MKIETFIQKHLQRRLKTCKALVVYDPEQRYEKIVSTLADEKTTVVTGQDSTIKGRETAMETWCRMGEEEDLRLLIYLPIQKPDTGAAKQENPYQIFALGGGEFPAGQGETFDALCRQAAPDLAVRLDRLFADGTPDFATINNLIGGRARWPKLKTLLRAESPAEILTGFLSPTPEQEKTLTEDSTWPAEFREFLGAVLEYDLKTRRADFPTVSEEIWRFLLFSEFVLDLPGTVPLPQALKDVPRASEPHAPLIFQVCDGLRDAEAHQQNYMEHSQKTAQALNLESLFAGVEALGERDTFAFEEQVYLKVFAEAVETDDFSEAERVAAERSRSIWVKHRTERQQLWTLGQRALALITAARELAGEAEKIDDRSEAIFSFYCERFRLADRLHRDFEQAVADVYGEPDVLEGVVAKARSAYFRAAEALQHRFLEAVRAQGWPVSGQIRQAQVFDRFLGPWLKERQKVAFFMVDALRYELAVELENELSKRWTTRITPVCAQLPTVTPVGMAALMPGAEGRLKLVREKGELIPHVDGQRVLIPADRFNFIRRIYGDRCHLRDMDDLVTKARIKIPETAQLLLVKTTDIDQIGEINPLEARRLIPRLTQKIIAAVNRAQKLGFARAVIATDHGFVLFDEQQAGDGVPRPDGEWEMSKTRCLLGKCAVSENVQVFGKTDVGIEGDFEDYVVPRSFGTFVKGHPYAHEGLSLQECVLPVIDVDFEKQGPETLNSDIDISLSYKAGKTDRITTRRPMIEVSVFSAMFDEPIEFRIEAVSGKKGVGEVISSPHVNAATNTIVLRPGQAAKIPLKMEEEFHGSFEVKAVDPVTGVNHAALKLKTDYLD